MNEIKELRKSISPQMTQAAFARALGYADGDAYRKYEVGARPTPHLLHLLMQAMAETGWRPDGWPDSSPAGND